MNREDMPSACPEYRRLNSENQADDVYSRFGALICGIIRSLKA